MKQISEDLLKSANQIRDKYRAYKWESSWKRREVIKFSFLIEPLKALAKENKIDTKL